MSYRLNIILISFISIFLFLISRLFFLQYFNHFELSQKVTAQKFISEPLNAQRGEIYDRNMIPLTGTGEKTNLVVIPQMIKDVEEAADVISKNTNIDYETIKKNIAQKKLFQCKIEENQIKQLKTLNLDGILIIKSNVRYSKDMVANHTIGYINSDNDGQFGIEKGYNDILKRAGTQSIGIIVNRLRNPIQGWGYRAVEDVSEKPKLNIKLTLDYHLQKIVENAFDKYKYDGAAVLIDVKSGDILGLVSRPSFDSDDVAKYFTSPNKELINKALYPYNLGSIFKIVVAEAAFENQITKESDKFICTGSIDVDGQVKRCATHSNIESVEIDFVTAFADSCNTAFIQTGLKVGYKNIVEAARKFGLGQSVGLDKDGLQEDPGLIQYNKYVSNREIANLSIGQGSLLVTPLQVANLLTIVANNGIKKEVNIVDSIVDDNGKIVKNMKKKNDTLVFSKDNTQRVKKMMEQVTEVGTGTEANLKEYGGIAGKTSSAETGIYNGDEQIIHAWFGGYFPENNPRYALALIIENGKSGSRTAAPIFRKIAYDILSLGY